MPEPLEFHASCIPGTERALRDELSELGFRSARLNRGGIPFRGPREEGWRACLTSRIAQRIQLVVSRFPAPTEDALYGGVNAIPWEQYVGPSQTLAVRSVSQGSALRHTGFVALKAKDAIVDRVRDRAGRRPSVSKDDPDLKVFVYLAGDNATLCLDLAGEPLHRRGYRLATGEAPLRETLAAAILRLSGWDRETPLIDPMCGSGTIAIEAAQWAAGLAPGLSRERFGFERWADFGDGDAERLRALRGELRGSAGEAGRISGADIAADAIKAARSNARSAGVRLSLKERSVLELQSDGSRNWLVSNPPYGRRLDASPDFLHAFTAKVQSLHGWQVCLLTGTPEYERRISIHPAARYPIKNGDIDCDLLIYDVP